MRLVFKYFWNVFLRTIGIRKMQPCLKGRGRSIPRSGESIFIILNPTWPDPPTAWFGSQLDAEAVAKTLAVGQPGDDFYILKAVKIISSEKKVKLEVKELPAGPQ